MAKKKKNEEYRELSLDELKHKENELRKELLNTKLEKASHQLKNPIKLREVRREIARVLTIANEKKGA